MMINKLIAIGALAAGTAATAPNPGQLANMIDTVDTECPDNIPVLRKWNQTTGCNYDGDNTLILWWPANWGSNFVRTECDHIGGHYFLARRGVHFCDDPDF